MNPVLVEGAATGEIFILERPLSFWGGFNPETGMIVDAAHPQHGESLTGRIVVMPHGRGSSSSSAVLAEALRLGTGPAAIILGEPDQIVITGVFVARMLYAVECPVVVGDIPTDARGVWRVSCSGPQPVH
jgi:predicted aconitase with swiveling domain